MREAARLEMTSTAVDLWRIQSVQSVQSMQRKYEKITSSKGVPTWIALYLWIIGNYW